VLQDGSSVLIAHVELLGVADGDRFVFAAKSARYLLPHRDGPQR
jgi:hypothetical protein